GEMRPRTRLPPVAKPCAEPEDADLRLEIESGKGGACEMHRYSDLFPRSAQKCKRIDRYEQDRHHPDRCGYDEHEQDRQARVVEGAQDHRGGDGTGGAETDSRLAA